MAVAVKICGITNVEDALAAARFGADFIGLNFYSGSPRCVSEEQARLILQALPTNVRSVALFVNEPWERIRETVTRLGIIGVQVHGDVIEPCPYRDLRWTPSIPIRDHSSLDRIVELLDRWRPRGPYSILLDAHAPGLHGGTGRTIPWSDYIHRFGEIVPHVPVMLAGGLTPDNVAEAIRIVRPWAVDVASGVESSPGKKDHDKMRRFIENARGADGPLTAA